MNRPLKYYLTATLVRLFLDGFATACIAPCVITSFSLVRRPLLEHDRLVLRLADDERREAF